MNSLFLFGRLLRSVLICTILTNVWIRLSFFLPWWRKRLAWRFGIWHGLHLKGLWPLYIVHLDMIQVALINILLISPISHESSKSSVPET